MSSPDAIRALVRLARLLERASPGLSLAHFRVLAAVADGDERASRLARRLALGKPAISSSVDALCRRGLLTRAEVADDQRAVALKLTREGRKELAAAERAMRQAFDRLLDRTDAREDIVAALERLSGALDEFGERSAVR